jgi:hypothetical protein
MAHEPSHADLAAALWPEMAGDDTPADQAPTPAPHKPAKATGPVDAAAALWPEMAKNASAKPQEKRIVARASGALSQAERIFPDMAAQASPAEDAGGADEAAPAQGDEAAAPEEAPIEIIELAPGLELTAPEGFEEFSRDALDAFAPIVERNNLPKQDAQELLDLHAAAIVETVETVHSGNLEAFAEIERQWAAEARRDPELCRGGFDANLKSAKSVLRQFAPEGLRDDLKVHGLSNNPRFIKFLTRVHKAIHQASMRRYGYR